MKRRGNICLNVTLRSSVWSGWMPLSRPGSSCSLFYKTVHSSMQGACGSLRAAFLLHFLHIIALCSYEFMRKNLIFYRTEIHRLTGKVSWILFDVKMVPGGEWRQFWVILMFVFFNVFLLCHHRTHWNSTEYRMKHAFRSATTCRLHLEIPHPCSLASCVYSLVLAQVHNLLLVGWKSVTIFLSVLIYCTVCKCYKVIRGPAVWVVRYLCLFKPENTVLFWVLASLFRYIKSVFIPYVCILCEPRCISRHLLLLVFFFKLLTGQAILYFRNLKSSHRKNQLKSMQLVHLI